MNTLTLGGGQEAGPLAAGSRPWAKALAGTLENWEKWRPFLGSCTPRARAGVSAPLGPSLAKCPHTSIWTHLHKIAWGLGMGLCLPCVPSLWATDPLVGDIALH